MLVLLMLLIGGTVATVDAARRARDARADLLIARDELTVAREIIGPLARFNFASWPSTEDAVIARASLRSASERLTAARDRLGWTAAVAPVLGPLPGWGEEIAASGDLLDAAETITLEAAVLLEVAAPILEGDSKMIEAARTVFVGRAERLDASLARIEEAQSEIMRLDAIEWGGPFAAAESMLSDLLEDLGEVAEGRLALAALSGGFDAIFGFGEPSTFLVLGQNDHEIRPTGGFIGTIGLIEMAEGGITTSDYRSSYEYSPDGPQERPAPPQMVNFLGAAEWHARDGNLSPHFPTSAEQVLTMVEEDRGITARHVLAIDTSMVALLLDALGPVETPDFPVALTAENWFEQVEAALFEASFDVGRNVARANYLGPVVRELLLRAEQAEREQLPRLVTALRSGATGRHFQIYSREPEVQRVADQFVAAGRLEAPPGSDFVAVVDANFSYSKIQPAIRRDITYLERDDSVDLVVTWVNDPATVEGQRYARFGRDGAIWGRHQREFRLAPGVFGNFVQLYLHSGVEIINIHGFDYAPTVREVMGFTEIAGFVEVQPDQQRTVLVTYRQSADAQDHVSLWKQGGQSHGEVQVLQVQGDQQVTLYRGAFDQDLDVSLAVPAPTDASSMASLPETR